MDIEWGRSLLITGALAAAVYLASITPEYLRRKEPISDTLYIERIENKFGLSKSVFKGEKILIVNNTPYKNFTLKITAKDAPDSYEKTFWFDSPDRDHIAYIDYAASWQYKFHARFIYFNHRDTQVVHGLYLLTQTEHSND